MWHKMAAVAVARNGRRASVATRRSLLRPIQKWERSPFSKIVRFFFFVKHKSAFLQFEHRTRTDATKMQNCKLFFFAVCFYVVVFDCALLFWDIKNLEGRITLRFKTEIRLKQYEIVNVLL